MTQLLLCKVTCVTIALSLAGCEEPPPCGLLSINSTVHCHSDTPPPPTEELPGHEPIPQQPLYPYQPHQRG